MSRVTRAQRLEQIRALKAEGLTARQIGERLGITRAGVTNILNDPDGSKQRERRKRYQGQCADCGMPTDGSSGYNKGPSRCWYCATGVPRPVATKPRLCVPVRLTDIPADVRLAAVRDAARIERDEHERLEILLAAIEPSDRVYWVAESARPLVESWTQAQVAA